MLNFLIGEAKMAIYLTRRDRLQGGTEVDPVALWKCNIKARLRLEFHFHKAMGKVEDFLQLWRFKNILCEVNDGKLNLKNCLC